MQDPCTTLTYDETVTALENIFLDKVRTPTGRWDRGQHSSRTNGARRIIKFRSANVVQPFLSMRNIAQAGNVVELDESNPHI